jgi:ABC-type lipoprotein export system ATPase subunit
MRSLGWSWCTEPRSSSTGRCGVNLSIGAGEMVAIVGPSGSGKTRIINMTTGVDRPAAGSMTVGGERIDQLSEEALASWRGENVGIVFQLFQLPPTLTAQENAVLPLDFARTGSSTSGLSAASTTSGWRVGDTLRQAP